MSLKNKISEIVPLKEWLNPASSFPIISGPCSAESREQVLLSAEQIHKTGIVCAFRSGIWKPRTRPGEFEGHGEEAIAWLKEAREMYNLPLAVEVATPKHVEICLNHGIDILWIGARTSVNPFSVQELAEALKGVDIPVMVKNPLNPDLGLWIGVLERFYLAGIRKLAAIHRGFNTYEKTKYRNEPLWNIPIKLKSTLPQLPVITDPSHIAGIRSLVPEVVQQALLLDMDGIMIEAHPDPDNALTDAAQQVEPAFLNTLFESLKIPERKPDNPCNDLEKLRSIIDELDASLINVLAKRMKVVNDIARIKKDCKMTVLQVNRWNEIVNRRTTEGEEKGLRENFLRNILEIIHKESIDIQSEIISKQEP